MHLWASIAGIVLIFVILMDAFETVVLPRRIKRHFRIASLFYKNTWGFWTRWDGISSRRTGARGFSRTLGRCR